MRLKTFLFLLLTGLTIALTACLKKQTASPIPEIAFKDFQANKDTANLYLSFIDGDGDIGLTLWRLTITIVLFHISKNKREFG